MNNNLEGQIMREFPLLQKKIILYFFFLHHSLGEERKCYQKSSEKLAEACSNSQVLVNTSTM